MEQTYVIFIAVSFSVLHLSVRGNVRQKVVEDVEERSWKDPQVETQYVVVL